MPRALVYEDSVSGHRAYYSSRLLEVLLKHGADVAVASPDNMFETPEGQLHFEKLKGEFEFLPLNEEQCNPKNRFAVLRELAKQEYDHVYVPYADGLIQQWGRQILPSSSFPRETSVEGLMMRGAFAYPIKSTKRKIVQHVSLAAVRRSRWERLYHLDPLVQNHINRKTGGPGKAFVMPETISVHKTSRKEARQRLGLSESSIVIVCPGQVNQRKGVNFLIESIMRIYNPDVQLVLIGRTDRSIAEFLQSQCKKELGKMIVWKDRFATELEFEALFSACNLVCLPYHGHIGSSSIAIRAAKHDRDIVATDWGWLGWATNNFDLGTTCDVTNPKSFDEALVNSINKERSSNRKPTDRCKRFLDFHTEENHLAHWIDFYCRRHSVSPIYKKTEWHQDQDSLIKRSH